ncbi:hypothetical protein HKCCE4037_01075 [Rhodobacterales bacterium HKCCE4037]|nr:hypothetical protein [Rhodobacterales bacterium HKCCE4037]
MFPLVVGAVVTGPAAAFTVADCSENYVSDALPAEARATELPTYFVEPGQLGTDLICTLVPSDTYGPIIQVSEAIPDRSDAAFVQYFPDSMQILRTGGDGAGLALSACGPIPDSVPPEQNPGGTWCQIDISLGRGVTFDLEYDTEGALTWLNFEVSGRENGLLAGSTLAPVLASTAPEDLRAAVFLTDQDETHLLRYVRTVETFRTVEPDAILDLYRALRETPQDVTIVIETGDPETGPFAQAAIPARVLDEIMAELSLLERLFRSDRAN